MKRFWLGIGILFVLVVLGVTATVGMHRICDPLTHQLEQAAQAAQAGQWEQALRLSGDARARWEHFRKLSASVTSHEPMEEADALFQMLEVFYQQRDQAHFAECCVHLASLTDAISESQSVYWWTVL